MLEISWPELQTSVHHVFQLVLALLLGGLVGAEREIHGRWAGLRTHMLVSLGCAMFAILGSETSDGSTAVTRVIQGIATGVGFLGAGTILKNTDRAEVRGLTTASSIWLAAALGTAVGVEAYVLAIAAAIATLVVLAVLKPVELKVTEKIESRK